VQEPSGCELAGELGVDFPVRRRRWSSEAPSAPPAPTGIRARWTCISIPPSSLRSSPKEIQPAGDEGFEYLGQTVFESTFGGKEVGVILQRDLDTPAKRFEYKLLATSRTSTMQKELRQAGESGFQFLGITVGKTAMGGSEVVCFLRRVVE